MSSYTAYHRAYYQAHKAERLRYNAERKELLIRLHMCRECGGQDAYTLIGRTRCAECVTRETERCRERRGYQPAGEKKEKPWINRPRGGNGICWQCNKEPVMDGKRLCSECYRWKVEIASRNLLKSQGKNHPWRNRRREDQDMREKGQGRLKW